ncbi:MAG: hypothetical protein U0031_11765 [Thermomicrobiales bacterium]
MKSRSRAYPIARVAGCQGSRRGVAVSGLAVAALHGNSLLPDSEQAGAAGRGLWLVVEAAGVATIVASAAGAAGVMTATVGPVVRVDLVGPAAAHLGRADPAGRATTTSGLRFVTSRTSRSLPVASSERASHALAGGCRFEWPGESPAPDGMPRSWRRSPW